MRNFTFKSISLFKGALMMSLLLATVFASGQADLLQSHTLRVSAPEGVAGDYQLLISGDFGASFCATDDITAEVVLIEGTDGSTEGCDTVLNDLTGKIAIIDRGSCGFSLKAYNAQQKGALAVIVCDNQVSSDYVSMAGSDFADEVTIPALFMLKADCDIIKTGLADGLMATIDRNDVVDEEEVDAIYSESFNGGLNGWTTNVTACSGSGNTEGVELWRWVNEGEALGSCGGGIIQSPTRCDGAVAFESDWQDSGGNGCGGNSVGTGPCPAPHGGTLTSPLIDLTTSSAAGYSLRFKQLTRQFNSEYFVEYSFDEGATWSTVAVNTEIAINEFNLLEDDVVKVPLIGSADASSVLVRFRFEAFYYFWVIDEVQIVTQEANNLQVDETFFAIPINAATPLSQVEPIPFMADIANIGSAEQTNVNLNVTIFDSEANELFSADNEYFNVGGNAQVFDVPFPDTYTPQDTGFNIGVYSISADLPDADSSDNAVGFGFAITENLFTKEFGPTRTIIPASSEWETEGEVHSWAYGNYFYVPNGDGMFVNDVIFGLGNPSEAAGLGVVLTLYEWTGDTNNDGNMDADERVPQAFSFYIISGDEDPNQLITVPFPGEGEPPVELKDNTAYVIMMEYFASDQTNVEFLASENFDYWNAIVVSELTGNPRYASFLGINGDLTTESYSSFGFGTDFVPVVRMTVSGMATNTEDLEDINNEFTVFPNPAKETVNLQFALQDQADKLQVSIIDVAGRTILSRDYDNIQREIFNYNVSKLPAGTYFMQVTTDSGTGTKRFVVSK